MSGVQTGAMDRALQGLTIGVVKSIGSRKAMDALEGLAEREEQFKIEVQGRGEEFPSWTAVDIEFENWFVDATGQRDSDFTTPHFMYGAYIPVGGPVGLTACVTKWRQNDRGETIGCQLYIGAMATDVARTFSGELHAVFQGYGMPSDVYGDIEALELG